MHCVHTLSAPIKRDTRVTHPKHTRPEHTTEGKTHPPMPPPGGSSLPNQQRSRRGGSTPVSKDSQVPNLYVNAIQVAQLRQHHSFVALPDVEAVKLAGPPTHK